MTCMWNGATNVDNDCKGPVSCCPQLALPNWAYIRQVIIVL